jgi:hypothetical protein
MSFYGQVVKDFNNYPALVAKVTELLAKGDYVCVLLGDDVAVATTWDDSDISAIAKKAHLDPKEDGSFGYLCWEAGGTVDKPVVAGTLAITTKGKGSPLSLDNGSKVVTFEFGGQTFQKAYRKVQC